MPQGKMYKGNPNLNELEAKYSHDLEDNGTMRTIVNITEAVPGVGLLKAAFHGFQILGAQNDHEREKYHFRAQRAAGTQLRCVTTLTGGITGGIVGLAGGPAGIIAGAATGSIAGGQFTDAVLPNRRSIVGKIQNGQGWEGATEIVLDGVFGALGPGQTIKSAAKSVYKEGYKEASENVVKSILMNPNNAHSEMVAGDIGKKVGKRLGTEAAKNVGKVGKEASKVIGKDLGSAVKGFCTFDCQQMTLQLKTLVFEGYQQNIILFKDFATMQAQARIKLISDLVIIVVKSEPVKNLVTNLRKTMTESLCIKTIVISTFQNMHISEKQKQFLNILKILGPELFGIYSPGMVQVWIDNLVSLGENAGQLLRIPKRVIQAFDQLIEFFKDLEKRVDQFDKNSEIRIVEVIADTLNVEKDEMIPLF